MSIVAAAWLLVVMGVPGQVDAPLPAVLPTSEHNASAPTSTPRTRNPPTATALPQEGPDKRSESSWRPAWSSLVGVAGAFTLAVVGAALPAAILLGAATWAAGLGSDARNSGGSSEAATENALIGGALAAGFVVFPALPAVMAVALAADAAGWLGGVALGARHDVPTVLAVGVIAEALVALSFTVALALWAVPATLYWSVAWGWEGDWFPLDRRESSRVIVGSCLAAPLVLGVPLVVGTLVARPLVHALLLALVQQGSQGHGTATILERVRGFTQWFSGSSRATEGSRAAPGSAQRASRHP
jgi:hypothetical protein